jgi:ribonucleoside-diphosphate reductase beta chain
MIDMTHDVQHWNTGALTLKERWIIEMGVGYFSAAEGIVGDSVLHVIEENLTAAELKHASLRQIAEESSIWIRCFILSARSTWISTK